MSRFLSLILLLACISLIAWFLPSTRSLNNDVGAFPTSVAAAEEETAFRILFGMTDRESTKWDGPLAVSAGARGPAPVDHRLAGARPGCDPLDREVDVPRFSKLSINLAWKPEQSFCHLVSV